jgi:hypothetical protein
MERQVESVSALKVVERLGHGLRDRWSDSGMLGGARCCSRMYMGEMWQGFVSIHWDD